MSTIPSVQLFRNSRIITGRTAAAAALENQKSFVADGGLILARYSDDGSENGVKTLLGIVRNGGGTNAQLTIIDVEGAAENVQSAITSAINSLNKGDAEVEGQYVTSVSETKGIITVTRKDLPSLNKTFDSGKAITAITQTKGLVSVEFGGVAAANVSVADTNNKFTATNVEDTLLEIKTSLDNAIGTGGTVEKQISDAINALNSEKSGTSTSNHITVGVKQVDGIISSVTVSDTDIASATLLGATDDTKDDDTAFGRIAKEAANRKAAIEALNLGSVGGADKVITTISQSNGIVSATAATLSADNVRASEIASSDATVAVTGTKVSEQIASLATSIKSVKSEAKSYSIEKISSSSTGLSTNVLEAYKLIDEDGAQAGETINIYKDSSLKSVALDGQTLNFTYILADGSESTVGVDVSTFLAESEFSDGLEVVDHVVKVKRAEGSENFLTVGADGVKLSGVQNAIDTTTNNKISALNASIKGESTHVDVTVGQANGKITSVTVANKDIASAGLLGTKEDASTAETAFGYIANEVAARTAAIKGLKLDSVGGTGKVITTISQADGKVSASASDLTASNVKATASSSSATAVAVDGATVEAQIASLAKSIKSASTAAAAAHTEVEAKTDGHVRVSVAKSSDNTHDVVTITENDIASANALTAETSSRQSQDDRIEASIGLAADGSHVTTSGNYTNGATTVVGEIAALDTQLKAVSDTLGTGVTTAEGKTVTEQLQALSGTTGDGSDATSVNGAKAYAKKYADDLVNSLDATITSSSETTEHAITIVQTNGKIASITLGAFDCGTY